MKKTTVISMTSVATIVFTVLAAPIFLKVLTASVMVFFGERLTMIYNIKVKAERQ